MLKEIARINVVEDWRDNFKDFGTEPISEPKKNKMDLPK